LIDKLLTLDPKKRITASQALDSEYFWSHPLPSEPSSIPPFPPSHEFQVCFFFKEYCRLTFFTKAKKRKQQQSQADAIKRQRLPSAPVSSGPGLPYPNNGNQQQYNRYGIFFLS
jgi:serine/threonine protein kinase